MTCFDDRVTNWEHGLPPAANRRIEHQLSSRTSSSLFSAPAAASARAASFESVGEVFGCSVVDISFNGGGCGWWSTASLGMRGQSPVLVSGRGSYASFTPYVRMTEGAWETAVDRALTEAAYLGAHGVVGVSVTRRRLDVSVWEYTAVGTAVRSTDPILLPYPTRKGAVWSTSLDAEHTASAILAGFRPERHLMALSIATKHEDWLMQQQTTMFAGNVEIEGMTAVLQAARQDVRRRITDKALRDGPGQLIVTDMWVQEFDTVCSQEEKDVHAEATIVGTTLVPLPATHRRAPASALTVIPLS
ncbi:heavy metal-binding domain-containing protein [Gryllotalpicola reticulitermitis]|uniref:Heavy metal-binding domain-containing protein n=1 Tax=Gryllotalpicola reticulitermitis TaxID=1184153 RepID=A0ABV8Q9Q9_9MICO